MVILKFILSSNPSFDLVNSAPYDGIVTDEAAAAARGLPLPSGEYLILKITNAGQPLDTNQLMRPIRKEHLLNWLVRVKAFKEHKKNKQIKSVALTRRCYQLIRWPPTELLAGQHQKYRICSTLCRASLSLSELSEATQEPVINCKAMLEELAIFQVLHIDDHLANRHARLSTAPSSLATKKMSWIKQVRRRLGI